MIKLRELYNSNYEILEKVIKGFDLIKSSQGFKGSYTTKNGKATPELVNRINIFIKNKLKSDTVKAVYEKMYGTINFLEKT